jgi:hypothetical protein
MSQPVSADNAESDVDEKKERGRFSAGFMAGGLAGAVVMTGVSLALIVLPNYMSQPQDNPSALAVSPPPGVGPEGTLGMGAKGTSGLGGVGLTRHSALGRGGREWPLVFLIGRQKAATTSLAKMMFDTHLFCRPYNSRGKPQAPNPKP